MVWDQQSKTVCCKMCLYGFLSVDTELNRVNVIRDLGIVLDGLLGFDRHLDERI